MSRELPPFDDSKDQMCDARTWVGEMRVTAHAPGCDGYPQCTAVPWSQRQVPHMAKECPRCLHRWVEGRV